MSLSLKSPGIDAITVAFPGPIAEITPSVTVTTDSSLLSQTISVAVAFSGPIVTASLYLVPLFITSSESAKLNDAAATDSFVAMSLAVVLIHPLVMVIYPLPSLSATR